MVRRLILASKDESKLDDKDYYGNKRLECAGQLLSILFEDAFKHFNTELEKLISKELENRKIQCFSIDSKMNISLIFNKFEHTIKSGN